jgi:ACS family tartrate transporter-like MFS transporter
MSIQLSPSFEPVEPRAVTRKVALRILPLVFILYLVAYLDRANVGFAKEQLQQRLGLPDEDFARVFGWGSGIFFIGYLLLEVPGTLLVEHWSARKWFARILVSWGVCSMATALIRTPWQFFAIRFLLGVAEAGFFPGIIVYFTHWFPRAERGRAYAGLVLGIPVSLALGARVSARLLEVHWLGLEGWQWVFILEGLPAVVLGFAVPFLLTDRPRQARWLGPAERDWLERTLEAEKQSVARVTLLQALGFVSKTSLEATTGPEHRASVTTAPGTQSLVQESAANAIADSKPPAPGRFTVWLLALGIFATNTGGYALVFWLPAAVKDLLQAAGHENTDNDHLNWLALAYLFGLAGVWLSGRLSDSTREWKWHCVAGQVLTAVFLTAMVAGGQRWEVVVAWLCLVQLFAFFWPSPFWVLPTLTLSTTAAAVAIGFINMCANLAGQVGPALFGEMQSRGYSYRVCLMVAAGWYLLGGVIVAFIRVPRVPPAAEKGEP